MPITSHRPSLRAWLIAALLCVPLFAAAPAAADVPPNSIQWSVVPADAGGPDGRISLRHAVDPGGTATDAIAVTNSGAVDAEFEVATGTGVVGSDGAFDVVSAQPGEAGEWIRLDGTADGRIAVPAGQTRVLPVTITVPADATPGDHPAGITVGVARDSDDVTVRHRIGVRVHLQVFGTLAPALAVTDVTSSFAASANPFEPGTVTVEYTLHNTGNVRLGASERIEVAGAFGLAASTNAGAAPVEILPGTSVRQSSHVTASPLLLLFGSVEAAPVALGDDVLTLPAAATAGFALFAFPWAVLLGLLVIGAGIAVVIVLRRRARARMDAAIEAAVAASHQAPLDRVGASAEH